MTRAVLGGLVGRSPEWVKAIECGRLRMPRLALLLRMADVLGITDLKDLTGDERLSTATYTKAAHDGLPAIKDTLARYPLFRIDEEPTAVAELDRRVRQAWQLWHGSGSHRSRVAALLPDLLTDLQQASRARDGDERRHVLAVTAQAYHLTQLYLSFQPASELIMLTGDRALMAAQDADDPHAIAAAAWYMNHVYRDAGERSEARVELAMRAADLLTPERGPEDRALWGLLHLAAALSHAKVGRSGDAWRHWDHADEAARRLGDAYSHPWLIFGRGMVDAYAITMNADLMKGGAATQIAERIDFATMPSATRRSFHLIESARAYSLQREPLAVIHLLKKAYEASPETTRFNLFTRSTTAELATTGNTMVRSDARYLANKIGVQVA